MALQQNVWVNDNVHFKAYVSRVIHACLDMMAIAQEIGSPGPRKLISIRANSQIDSRAGRT